MVSPNNTHPFDGLRRSIRGTVHVPGDPHWDSARLAWNLAADQRPSIVVEVADADDVVEVVRFARRERLRLAPQSTGHGAAMLGLLDDTVLLKTARLRDVSVDPAARVARVAAGALSADVAAAAGERALAPVGGLSPTVGLAGLTLNGGFGWLGRTHGLAASNLRAAEVVTADGKARRVDADNDPDLIWALRGGGGSFAVVTALELELHSVPQAFGGHITWPGERYAEVLERWRAWTRDLPEAMSSVLRFMQFPDLPVMPEAIRGKRMTILIAVHLGPEQDAIDLLAPMRAGGAIEDEWAPVGAAGLAHVSPEPPGPAPAASHAWLLRELAPGLAERLVEKTAGSIAPLGMIEMRHLGGALARPAAAPGPLTRVDGAYTLSAAGQAPTPEMREGVESALAQLADTAGPWLSDQALLNFRGLPVDPAAAFGPEAWDELRRIRTAHDPDGLVVANHPVPSLVT